MLNKLLAELKRRLTTKRFLFLILPYIVLVIAIIFLWPYNAEPSGATLIFVLFITLIMVNGLWSKNEKKSDNQNKDS